ncbi:hypothetical protein NM208_g12389 [Fusarium decemcellulare]|uniref:Uncharacterized protein n=1 Tax=Fusarium decemcellulare TaxID=57161 RepID=A0ACC1RNT4_9HYPO|nr:hypothetical protein NM208_g12389 [Fusarium decemcellulare]
MSNHPERRSSKRLAAADFERDDDFQFVRKSKRTKTEKVEDPEPVKKSGRGRTATKPRATKGSAINGSIPEEKEVTANEPIPTAKPTTRKSTRRKASVDASNEEPPLKILKRPTRRSVRVSGDTLEEAVPAPAPEPVPAPVSVPQTNGTSRKRGRRAKSPPPPAPRAGSVAPRMNAGAISHNRPPDERHPGMRGRRASSLIESGQTAIPHREVSPADFYKHIEAEGLTEPRRMKQLLTWCGERSLTGKPPHGTPNSNAILGARAIQDDLLRDFSSRSEFSDWFSREDDVPKAPVVLKPNPRNMELDEKLTQLEINIKRLQEEKKAWQAIRKPPPEQPPLFPAGETGPIVLPDFDLLDPEEGKIRGLLAEETASFNAIRSKTESRLRTIQSSLEFQIDQLADNVHKLEQRVLVAGKEADKVLSVSALRLRQREEREKASAGTKDMPVMEVLRSLGNILPEGGG